MKPTLCLHASSDDATLTKELLSLGHAFPHTRTIQRLLFHDDFPVDIRHNAKIFREKLAVWAADQLKCRK